MAGWPFFEQMPLWQKLTLVLGILIAITIFLGCMKLLYTRWQLRKWQKKLHNNGCGEEGNPEMVEAISPPERRGRKVYGNDVPFGVRAIESGIEVEGVWISRSNSPATTPGASPRLSATNLNSPKGKGVDRSSSIPHLAIPEPAHSYSRGSVSRGSTSRGSTSGNSSPERSRATSPTPEGSSKARPSYKPRQSSHLRFSSGNMLEEAVNEEDDSSDHQRTSSGSSNYSTKESNIPTHYDPSSAAPHPSIEQSRVPSHYEPKRPDSHTNFSLPQVGVSRSPIDLLPFTRNSAADIDSHYVPQTSSSNHSNPFKTPIASEFDHRAPSFRSFVESDYGTSSHSLNQMDGAESQGYFSVRQEQTGNPHVVRKVNSGFEVLSPGTFPPPQSMAEQPRQEKRESRKLHKRNQSSSSRKNSQFIEGV